MTVLKISKCTDEELVRLLLETGNTVYYEELYGRYFQKVYYQTLSYVKDNDEAKDISQDIFIKLYDRLSKFQGKSKFSTWIFSFTRNAVLDHLRKNGKMKQQQVDDSGLANIPEVEDNEMLQLRSDRLAYIMDQISPDNKSLLIMMYAQGWQIDEIAELLGTSESAIKMRLKRAKHQVKTLYEKKYGGG